jgi:hypothetical protein
MGWAHNFAAISQPTFEHLADPQLLAGFISFKRCRAGTCQHMSQVMRALQRGVAWLRHNSQHATLPSFSKHMDKLDAWVASMQTQVNNNLAPAPSASERDPEVLLQQGKLMSPPQLLGFVAGLVEGGQQAIASVQQGSLGKATAAEAVQDGLIGAFTFGYLPPMRPSLMSSLRGPWDEGNPCRWPGCQHPSKCPGNLVSFDEDSSTWQVVAAHHKTSKHQPGSLMKLQLPKEPFGPLLDFQCFGGGMMSMFIERDMEDSPSPFLLLNPSTGSGFKEPELGVRWQKLQPAGMAMPMQKARHVFVTASRQQQGNTPAGDAAAAMVMGNSVGMWDAHYDLKFSSRKAQQAIDGMAAFRQGLQQHAAGGVEAPVSASGGGGGGGGGQQHTYFPSSDEEGQGAEGGEMEVDEWWEGGGDGGSEGEGGASQPTGFSVLLPTSEGERVHNHYVAVMGQLLEGQPSSSRGVGGAGSMSAQQMMDLLHLAGSQVAGELGLRWG